jgi:transcriptional regulator GlxA family with amidase domain
VPDLRERHYTVSELASDWNVSRDTIRRLFLHEQGVLNLGKAKKNKRVYRALRIPQSIAVRVYARLTNNGGGTHWTA